MLGIRLRQNHARSEAVNALSRANRWKINVKVRYLKSAYIEVARTEFPKETQMYYDGQIMRQKKHLEMHGNTHKSHK